MTKIHVITYNQRQNSFIDAKSILGCGKMIYTFYFNKYLLKLDDI